MARKTKLTRKLINKAENLIKLGNYNSTVCQYLGIGETTWYRWMEEGEKATRGIKREFWESIKKAESHAEIRNVQIIQNAAQENWQASAWYLERKFHDRWGRKEKVDANVNHSGGLQNKVDLSGLTTEELRELAQLDREGKKDNSGTS